MPKSPIETRLDVLRRRVRQVLTLHGVCWVLAVAAGVATLSGVTDWLLDLSVGVRVIFLGLFVGGTLATVYRLLVVPFRVPLRDVDLALRVEAQFPKLNDELASAVEFLEESATARSVGSPALKQAVVADAARRVSAIDFNLALDWAATRRAALCFAGVLAVAIVLILASPASARIAVTRLVNPFGHTSWPRETHLALLDAPKRLVRGEPFRLTVQVSQGRVPARAEVLYRFEGGDTAKEPLRALGDRQFSGGLEAVTRSFDFYVRAGDGITDSSHVEVVPPPELQGLRVRLTFPSYTAEPPQELPEGRGQVTAVWGTQVDLSARSTKPLANAELRLEPDQTVPASLSPDGTELRASFKLEKTGSYFVALSDRDGFKNREASRYELRALDDQPPDVFIEKPASDIEVSPTADVPLRVLIKDDFGIQDVTLEHAGSSAQSETDVALWKGTDRPRRLVVEHLWHLAELGLSPGSSLTYRVTARDADDLRGPNVGQSRQLRLLVVAADDLTRRLEDRQLLIYQELERIRKLQAEARAQVTDLRETLRHSESLSKPDLTHLQSAEALQRLVNRRVSSPTEGLQSQVAQLQQDLANNHIANSAVNEQMAAVSAGLEQIAREELPSIEMSMARVRKAAEDSAGAKDPRASAGSKPGEPRRESEATPAVGRETEGQPTENSVRPPAAAPSNDSERSTPATRPVSAEELGDPNPQRAGLAQTQQRQDAVLAALDRMLEGLSKWETYRGIARDAKELLDQQEQIAQQTAETGRKTIGQKLQNLPAETQADLSKLAARQEQAREQLGRVQRKMEQMSGRLAESDPAAAESLREALEGSRQAGTAEQMQRAAQGIQQNQVGTAETAQQRAIDDLKGMLDTLENNRERDLAKIVAKLREAEKQLAEIRSRQAEQLKRTQEAQANQDPDARRRELEKLARQEKELQQETARLAQQLRRARAEQAGKTSSSASNRMSQASKQLGQGEGEQATAEQEKVLEDLEKARQEVAQARREAEAELAMEQLAKIADTLASLHQRQESVKEETVRLEQVRQEKGNWTRPQLASLLALTQAEEGVRKDTEKAKEILTAAPVFAMTLSRAITNMQRASDLLNDRKADAETQAAEQAAVDRLAQLLASLKKDEDSKQGEDGDQAGGQGDGQQGSGPPRDGIPLIAQLKMLRSLQLEINSRTQELAELYEREKKLTTAQQKELQSLGEEQGVLADLVRGFTQPADEGENP